MNWQSQPYHQEPAQKPPTCPACGERIVWIPMIRKDGSKGGSMPCEVRMEYGDGRKTLVALGEDQRGRMIPKASEEVLGREPHFGHCSARRADITSADARPDQPKARIYYLFPEH